MKCVTIYQPWAWLWLHGPKRVENRGWRLAHRGPLAIHAGRRQDKWMRGFYDDPVLHELVPECPPPAGLRYGAIIGVVDIVDCVLLDEIRKPPYCFDRRYEWLQDDSWAEGPWWASRRESQGYSRMPYGAYDKQQPQVYD